MELLSYTINGIVGTDYTITFVFSDGTPSQQTIDFGASHDAESLHDAIREYARAYIRGLQQPGVHTSILPLIGQTKTVAGGQ